MHIDRYLEIDAQMQAMPADWRLRWCEAAECGCLGCANGSGHLRGVSKQEWQEYLKFRGETGIVIDP
jgi:hypothetical protein